MRRRPPRAALFPYTRLFRSPPSRLLFACEDARLADRVLKLFSAPASQRCVVLPGGLRPGRERHALEVPQPDRKSTRLNSSHANISYAVFCLKKKTMFFLNKN